MGFMGCSVCTDVSPHAGGCAYMHIPSIYVHAAARTSIVYLSSGMCIPYYGASPHAVTRAYVHILCLYVQPDVRTAAVYMRVDTYVPNA